MVGSLAPAAAVARFWLLVKPVTLQASTLGINHVEVNAGIGTAGMPTRKQFAGIASANDCVVINPVPTDALGSHTGAAALVTAQGLAYEDLPVDLARPTAADDARFATLMKQHGGERVFVHSQISMRASVFAYPYRVLELGEDADLAYEAVPRVWQPSHQWRGLIRELSTARGRPLPFARESAAWHLDRRPPLAAPADASRVPGASEVDAHVNLAKLDGLSRPSRRRACRAARARSQR